MKMLDETRLAEMTASRLAHEVVGPLGAISNGLELIEELGADAGDDAMTLVSTSAAEAGARLAFYRMAYGRAGFGVTNLAQIKAVASEFLDGAPHHTLVWPLPPVLPSPPEGAGRVLLLLLELGRDALIRGGDLRVFVADAEVSVHAEGSPAELRDGLDAALSGTAPDSDLTPRTVHAALARCFAKEIGWRVSVVDTDNGLTLTARA
jgi:histidine phosphotransferase ChpT